MEHTSADVLVLRVEAFFQPYHERNSTLNAFNSEGQVPTYHIQVIPTIKRAISQQYTVLIYGNSESIDWLQKYEEIYAMLQSPGLVLLTLGNGMYSWYSTLTSYFGQHRPTSKSIFCDGGSGGDIGAEMVHNHEVCFHLARMYGAKYYSPWQLFTPVQANFGAVILPQFPHLLLVLGDKIAHVRSDLQSELQNYNFSWRETSFENENYTQRIMKYFPPHNPISGIPANVANEISKYGRVALYFRDRHIQLWKLVELVENTAEMIKLRNNGQLRVVLVWYKYLRSPLEYDASNPGITIAGFNNREVRAKLAQYHVMRYEVTMTPELAAKW